MEGHVIRYIEGAAWGISAKLKTVYLGTESEVEQALCNPKIKNPSKVVQQIIDLERSYVGKELKKENEVKLKEYKEKLERHKKARKLGVAAKTKKPRKPKLASVI